MKVLGDNKGALFYTLAGIMVIALVAVVAIHIMRTTYTPKTADSLHVQKLGDAIYSLQSEIRVLAREAQYPAVWKAGHNVSESGVNYYLTLSDGRKRLKKDLTKDFSTELDRLLSERAFLTTEDYYVIESSGINITVSRIDPSEVVINESTEGLTATIPLHMRAKYRDIRYEDHFNMSSETPVRIFDMFDRAKAFHENYSNNVQWATTIALYTRAYINGYDPTYTGSFLKEGHLAYDPLEQFLSGDIEAVKNFKLESIDDIGSIPVATWLTEWQYLSEPSFLPPSYDFSTGKDGNAKIVDLLKKNYDVDRSSDCGTLTGDEKVQCEEYNDPVKIREKAEALKEERLKLQVISNKIGAWTPKTTDTCDVYKLESEIIINEVTEDFKKSRAEQRVLDPAISFTTGTQVNDKIEQNIDELKDVESGVNSLIEILNNRLSKIGNDKCALPADMDCKCGKGPEDCDNSDDCLECDNPSCNKIGCSPGGDDYSCSSYGTDDERFEVVDCEHKTCEEKCEGESCTNECETEGTTKRVYIDQCNCQCHPRQVLIDNTNTELAVIKKKIDDRQGSLLDQENKLIARAATMEEAAKRYDELIELSSNSVQMQYDVRSDLDYANVKYFKETSTGSCYLSPNWAYRANGTCGDKTSSVGLYTAQVSAAVMCCAITQPCCGAVQYATQWFPAIYHVEGYYNISEMLVDDKNRIMLHNIFAGGDDLYGMNVTPKLFTHVAPEFVIYKNYKVEVKPKTMDNILVYLYLPKIAQTSPSKGGAVNKILSSFEDLSCTGKSC
jgi:hypothetical protein